ncbi:hypothetical protein [Mucilaginibacter sp.]|uniref:hypothetical protein n=1 Tax=Mucilaginibacter sp. TaxID=1882438 RepID=UPI003D0C62B3
MPSSPKVSLQINLSPGDYLHAKYLLKHQLKALSGQVDEILLTVDTRVSKGRFSTDWEIYKDALNTFLKTEIEPGFKVRIIFVDYSKPVKQAIAQYFFGGDHIPDKDFRGGPFYAYFFGLFNAANDLVFHLDSDIFLGGGSQTWINEAVQLFKNDASCFTVSPLPGPPHPEDILIGQDIESKIAPYTFAFTNMSTRIFMLDKSRFKTQKLSLKKPAIRSQIKALIDGNSNADLPEHMISDYLKKHHLKRIDFLGDSPGLWSLHPPYRSKTFYAGLQKLISDVENGGLPAAQNGYYDVVDEVCDWTEGRQNLKNKRWWKRYFSRA